MTPFEITAATFEIELPEIGSYWLWARVMLLEVVEVDQRTHVIVVKDVDSDKPLAGPEISFADWQKYIEQRWIRPYGYDVQTSWKESMGLRGDLPAGITFRRSQDDPNNDMGETEGVQAVLNGEVIGYLYWESSMVDTIYVEWPYRRMGVGTALLNAAEAECGHYLMHSPELSEDGMAWVQATDPDGFEISQEMFRGMGSWKESHAFDPEEEDLDPNVFNRDREPHKRIKSFIEKHVHGALAKHTGLGSQFFDLFLSGPVTSYRYNPLSDLDVHVVPAYDQLPGHSDKEEIHKHLNEAMAHKVDGSYLPGSRHRINVFVAKPGQTPDELFGPSQKPSYSLPQGSWYVEPDKKHEIESKALTHQAQRAESIRNKVKLLMGSPHAKGYKHFLNSRASEEPDYFSSPTSVMRFLKDSNIKESAGDNPAYDMAQKICLRPEIAEGRANRTAEFAQISYFLADMQSQWPTAYKMMPWGVHQIQLAFANEPAEEEQTLFPVQFAPPYRDPFHLAEIAGQYGEQVNEMEANGRPLPFNVNTVSFPELEQWYNTDNKLTNGWKQPDSIYQYSDGYSVHRLHDSQDIDREARLNEGSFEVPNFADVQEGKSLVYSLRNPYGIPEATFEVEGKPDYWVHADGTPLMSSRENIDDMAALPPLSKHPEGEPWHIRQVEHGGVGGPGYLEQFFKHHMDQGAKFTLEDYEQDVNNAEQLLEWWKEEYDYERKYGIPLVPYYVDWHNVCETAMDGIQASGDRSGWRGVTTIDDEEGLADGMFALWQVQPEGETWQGICESIDETINDRFSDWFFQNDEWFSPMVDETYLDDHREEWVERIKDEIWKEKEQAGEEEPDWDNFDEHDDDRLSDDSIMDRARDEDEDRYYEAEAKVREEAESEDPWRSLYRFTNRLHQHWNTMPAPSTGGEDEKHGAWKLAARPSNEQARVPLERLNGVLVGAHYLDGDQGNWIEGNLKDEPEVYVQMNVFDEPSRYGIKGGRISKLYMRNTTNGVVLITYERGWTQRNLAYAKYVDQLVNVIDSGEIVPEGYQPQLFSAAPRSELVTDMSQVRVGDVYSIGSEGTNYNGMPQVMRVTRLDPPQYSEWKEDGWGNLVLAGGFFYEMVDPLDHSQQRFPEDEERYIYPTQIARLQLRRVEDSGSVQMTIGAWKEAARPWQPSSDQPNLFQEELFAIPIEELELSVRVYNVAKRKGINTIGEFAAITPEDVAAWRSGGGPMDICGPRCQREIIEIQAEIAQMAKTWYPRKEGARPLSPGNIITSLAELHKGDLLYCAYGNDTPPPPDLVRVRDVRRDGFSAMPVTPEDTNRSNGNNTFFIYEEEINNYYKLHRISEEDFQLRTANHLKVIYNSDKDHILLGVVADTTTGDRILGSYDGTNVHLNQPMDQWMSTQHFRKLWVASFPQRPLHHIHVKPVRLSARPKPPEPDYDQTGYQPPLPIFEGEKGVVYDDDTSNWTEGERVEPEGDSGDYTIWNLAQTEILATIHYETSEQYWANEGITIDDKRKPGSVEAIKEFVTDYLHEYHHTVAYPREEAYDAEPKYVDSTYRDTDAIQDAASLLTVWGNIKSDEDYYIEPPESSGEDTEIKLDNEPDEYGVCSWYFEETMYLPPEIVLDPDTWTSIFRDCLINILQTNYMGPTEEDEAYALYGVPESIENGGSNDYYNPQAWEGNIKSLSQAMIYEATETIAAWKQRGYPTEAAQEFLNAFMSASHHTVSPSPDQMQLDLTNPPPVHPDQTVLSARPSVPEQEFKVGDWVLIPSGHEGVVTRVAPSTHGFETSYFVECDQTGGSAFAWYYRSDLQGPVEQMRLTRMDLPGDTTFPSEWKESATLAVVEPDDEPDDDAGLLYRSPEKNYAHEYWPAQDYQIDEHPDPQMAAMVARICPDIYARIQMAFEVYACKLPDPAVAMYISGTSGFPTVLLDLEKHRGYEDQLGQSIWHELQHGEQEANGYEFDEDDAEFGHAGH